MDKELKELVNKLVTEQGLKVSGQGIIAENTKKLNEVCDKIQKFLYFMEKRQKKEFLILCKIAGLSEEEGKALEEEKEKFKQLLNLLYGSGTTHNLAGFNVVHNEMKGCCLDQIKMKKIKMKKKDWNEKTCVCGHHSKDHSYNPEKSDMNLECDICKCKKFKQS